MKGKLKTGINVISEILDTLTSPNRYYVQFFNDGQDIGEVDILCKSVQLPEVSRTDSEYWKNGVKYTIPMNIGFTNEITLTFSHAMGVNDLRTKFIKLLETPSRNTKLEVGQFSTKPVLRKKKESIGQFISDTMGAVPQEKEYEIINRAQYSHVYVKTVGAVDLNSSSVDNPEFTVTFGFGWTENLSSETLSENNYPIKGDN